MNSRAQASAPINTIGVVIMVVLVVVAVSFFFFNGLNQQGGIMSKTSEVTVGGMETKLDQSIACIPPPNCCEAGESPEVDGCCCSGSCAGKGGCV